MRCSFEECTAVATKFAPIGDDANAPLCDIHWKVIARPEPFKCVSCNVLTTDRFPHLSSIGLMCDKCNVSRICHHEDRRCSKCGAQNPKFHCAGCRWVYYCDVKCQHADWTNHERKCASFQALN